MRKILLTCFGLLAAVGLHAQRTTDSLNASSSQLVAGQVSGAAVLTGGTNWDVFNVSSGTYTYGILPL